METSHSNLKNTVTAVSLIVALGIIYGDIGTSPLYSFKAIIGNRPITQELVYGGVSCIFWTLVFQTTIKYVWITLRADNDGEGGIFALYGLIKRYGKKIIIPTMIGACALLADGIITPAVSVTSAIEGLKIIPHMEDIHVVPIILFILSIVFFLQRFGSDKIGKAFGPIMLLWFTVILSFGMIGILKNPEVIKSLNPMYAFDLLVKYPHGFWILGAVFLCTTGAEALYSDLGHCGKKNIRITWGFVKTSLVINYLGQAAWLMHQGDLFLHERNPFFEMIPTALILPSIILSTLAAIVASQALISGSFTLINEAINLNFWPKILVKQPSDLKGQIYIPSLNFILWIGCMFTVLYFQNSTNMEAAYGLAITIAMLTTTTLLFIFLRYKLRWNKLAVYALMLVFLSIEISFFIANLVKFRDGGYVTILVGILFFFVMYASFYGGKVNTKYTKFIPLKSQIPLLTELSADISIPKFTTHLIYLTKSNNLFEIEERIIQSILAKKPKRADVYWFLHINRSNHPYTLDYEVHELVEDKIMKIVINVGFRIQPKTELYFLKIVQELVENKELDLHLKYNGSTKYNPSVDFKFVVIEKYLSIENEFAFREGLVLKSFFFLKRFAMRDEQAFGLEKSDVLVEQTPIVVKPPKHIALHRKTTY